MVECDAVIILCHHLYDVKFKGSILLPLKPSKTFKY